MKGMYSLCRQNQPHAPMKTKRATAAAIFFLPKKITIKRLRNIFHRSR